ncbi:site-specific DNA-methyltransferase [Helicobacter pylori]|uniref:site-specific DNA-methyltransferase (adenine-specific) n=1 Tax=Helicobacter pylori TaxID=210 RepID=A0AB37V079_HELPX|nr:site-specific DNA-methyltransferase [Helicobacter pylori]RVZ35400.1 site-specific DNA-methyltransferase [Helicobacter pylori]
MTDKNQAKKMGINIVQSQQENNPLFDMLLKNFPQTIKDGQVSLNAIKMLLGFNESMNDISGYELTWTGKGLANALYSEPCQKQLKLQEIFTPQNSASKHPNNAIIIGDNLDALKLLKSAYSEKIKMIYIDPPYNTGNDEFIYPDNFRQDYQKILREVGLMEIDENGKETESESLKFFKNTQGSGTHSGWLSFMLPRLKLARDLLKEDGVIFISIDDNECANLKILCDEIFGEDNFVACIIAESAPAGTQSSNFIAQQHSYCLVYGKYINENSFIKQKLTDEQLNKKYTEEDEYGKFYIERLWKRGIGGKKEDVPSLHFPVYYDEANNKIYIDEEVKSKNNLIKIIPYQVVGVLGRWTWSKEKMINERHKLIVKKVNGEWKLHKKQYKQDEMGKLPNSIIKSELARTELGSLELKKIMGEKVFDYPKSTKLMKHLISISTSTNSNDIILDFFAGSGTTAHAVMELNAEDKGNREFILAQIDEEIKEDKSAYDFCKNVLKSAKPVISDITIERVKRAAQKIIESSKDSGLDLGFKVYTLQDKAQITNDKEEITLFNHSHLTPFDKALNLALQCGKTLNQALEIIIKDKLYKCEDAYFCIVCDEEAQEYLAKSKNEMIFLDGYEEIDLEAFLNLNASFKERLSVVY